MRAVRRQKQLIIARDENYISEEVFKKFKEDCEECMKIINGYIAYLRAQNVNSKTNH